MIRVSVSNIFYDSGRIKISDVNAPFSVLVEGHAGGIKGSDTFCAAVSALGMTMVLTLASTDGLEQKVEQRDGFLKTEAVVELRESVIRRTEIILEFFITGMAELARIEPQRVAVLFNDINSNV